MMINDIGDTTERRKDPPTTKEKRRLSPRVDCGVEYKAEFRALAFEHSQTDPH
jgi:hypothetical protein